MRVAVTGNMGSGKSTFARMLESLGARLVDADVLARRVVDDSPGLRRELGNAFGADLLTPALALDRAELARRALADAAGRELLEALVRPHLEPVLAAELARADAPGTIAVLDAPLVFEWGIEHWFDRIIVVHAASETAAQRVVAGRGIPAGDLYARRAAQFSKATELPGVVAVDNSGSLNDLRAIAQKTWDSLQQETGT